MVLQKSLVNRLLDPVCFPVAQGAKESTGLADIDGMIVDDNSVLFSNVKQCLHNSENRTKLGFLEQKIIFLFFEMH